MSGTSSNRETAARADGSDAHRPARGAPPGAPRAHAGRGGPPHHRDGTGGRTGPGGHAEPDTGGHTDTGRRTEPAAPDTGGHTGTDPRTEPAAGPDTGRGPGSPGGAEGDRSTRVTVLVALAANLVIAVAKAAGGVLAGSPALLSEAAHSVADSLNEVFLLAALSRSRRPADSRHPFGYGKERFFWSLLAAVGIFVMGGCFSFFQGFEALRDGTEEKLSGYVAGLIVLGVALVAEAGSLLRALHQVRRQGGGLRDPALRTVVAEDGTAVLGVTLALVGMALHMVTGQAAWEASASLAIGVLLVYVAYRLGRDARDQLIGEAADPELSGRIGALLRAQPEIDSVEALFTMKLGLDSTLVAARIDLVPGLDSERVEEVADRIKRSLARTFPDAGQIFLDVTDRSADGAAESPAATGERGGA
ncbi:cation diffusion facilitator family transporter [Streptomyces rubradiris]|uniref:cation diffusion facilitator family transporter n=1 Tax=Streptomyces rubradiris TaxID=285531 RepID=UPI00340B812C